MFYCVDRIMSRFLNFDNFISFPENLRSACVSILDDFSPLRSCRWISVSILGFYGKLHHKRDVLQFWELSND